MPARDWSPAEPWNHLPLLMPAADVESKSILRACITARATLAELAQAVKLIPNQGVLISTLPLLEARASSEIENVVTTADRLFQALPDDRSADPATRKALRYREALLAGFHELGTRPIGTGTAETIASTIKGRQMRVRTQQDVMLANEVTGDVIYTPPQGEARLRDFLADWERYLHSEEHEHDPLVRLAVGHYQFEAIHPFSDGNGRTGRILNSLYLIEAGLLSLPILYLSRYIRANRSDSYRLLLEVTRNGNWEDWILWIVKGVEETAAWTLEIIGTMVERIEATRAHVQAALPTIYRHALVNLLFGWPYVRIANVVDAGLMERQTASRHLRELVRIGVLQEQSAGREKLFINRRFLTLLTSEQRGFAPFPEP